MPRARCRPVPLSPICAPVTERRAVAEAGGRGRAAGALRDVLVDLAVLVGTGAEALDRGDDHARVGLVDVLPGQPHAVERAGREILHQHVAGLDQLVEHALALRVLGVDRDRALVVVEHGEVERVGVGHVAQLAARDVADAGALDLDHVGAEPGEQLRAGRARLHVGEVEDAHACERLTVHPVGLAGRLRPAVGLRGGRLFGRRFLGALAGVEFHDLAGRFLRGCPALGFRPSLCLGLLTFGHLPYPPNSIHLDRPDRRRAPSWRAPASGDAFLFLLLQRALRVEVADAAALAAGRRIDHRVDERRLA